MAWQMLLYEPYLDPQPCRQAPSSRLRRQDVEACGDVMPLYNIGIWCYPTIYIVGPAKFKIGFPLSQGIESSPSAC